VEWLKAKATSSSPRTTKKKKEESKYKTIDVVKTFLSKDLGHREDFI
jgi:hypothetical protein